MMARKREDGAQNPAHFNRFNGAAPMMARKQMRIALARHLKPSFNGAAPMMARKRQAAIAPRFLRCQLQWSRANDGAETRKCVSGSRFYARFNGAAPMMARKLYPPRNY